MSLSAINRPIRSGGIICVRINPPVRKKGILMDWTAHMLSGKYFPVAEALFQAVREKV
jgi:hypothetical protein